MSNELTPEDRKKIAYELKMEEMRRESRAMHELAIHYDKVVLALSGGALGFLFYSLSNHSEMIQENPCMFFWLTLCFAVSLLSVLLDIEFGSNARSMKYDQLHAELSRDDDGKISYLSMREKLYTKVSECAHTISIIALFAGTISIIVFSIFSTMN